MSSESAATAGSAEAAEIPVGVAGAESGKQLLIWCCLALGAILFAFAPLLRQLPRLWWFDQDQSYYSHGSVVPLCAAFIVWDRWPRIKSIPVRGSNWAVAPGLLLIGFMWMSLRSEMNSLMSIDLVLALLCTTWFVAGWAWVKALLVPIGYLLLGLPAFNVVIDRFTPPLQQMSASLAFKMLQLVGQNPLHGEGTVIYLNNYSMNVVEACSGLKTLLAVTAIVAFFVIVARLRWWANVILVALVVPLSLLVNGLRIMLIGVVGNEYGDAAAHSFHDYSGYIALFICSVALYYLTKALGWKS
ncbi:MAG TPA: exosortase/archaeosortase family protein [Fimbriimonadaceae bacterium]|nr:exosortase/archaeosortase family protein [Fimbriimonadaceae bacterium]